MALAVTVVSSTETSSPSEWNYLDTTTSGSNRLLLVCIHSLGGIPDLVYFDSAMSLVASKTTGSKYVSIWKLIAPPTSDTIQVHQTGSVTYLAITAVAFSGADQTDGTEASASAGTFNNNATVNVTTLTDGAIVADCVYSDSQTLTVGADQTQRMLFDNKRGVSTEPKATAGSVTMSWSIAANDDWRTVAVAVKPYTEPTTTSTSTSTSTTSTTSTTSSSSSSSSTTTSTSTSTSSTSTSSSSTTSASTSHTLTSSSTSTSTSTSSSSSSSSTSTSSSSSSTTSTTSTTSSTSSTSTSTSSTTTPPPVLESRMTPVLRISQFIPVPAMRRTSRSS